MATTRRKQTKRRYRSGRVGLGRVGSGRVYATKQEETTKDCYFSFNQHAKKNRKKKTRTTAARPLNDAQMYTRTKNKLLTDSMHSRCTAEVGTCALLACLLVCVHALFAFGSSDLRRARNCFATYYYFVNEDNNKKSTCHTSEKCH